MPEGFGITEIPYPHPGIRALDKSSAAAVENSRFFVTRTGRLMGLGQRTVALDDVIAVLYGGRTPFVMWRAGERVIEGCGRRECYLLVGSCYVHGILDGEVVKNAGAEGSATVFLV
jgi:hypothetical protein